MLRFIAVMRIFMARQLWVVLSVVSFVSCSDPSTNGIGSAGDADAAGDVRQDVGEDADVPTDAGDAADAGEADAGSLHPCQEATAFPPSETVSGTIDPEIGEAHHYLFEAAAGEFITIAAQSQGTGQHQDFSADSALTLLSADGSVVVASMDDLGVGHAADASLLTRIATGGTYCVRIEHASSWSNTPPLPCAKFDYELTVARSDEANGDVYDKEPNDTAAAAQNVEFLSTGQTFEIVGMLDGASDVDVYRVSAMGNARFEVDGRRGGPGGPGLNGNGSTLLAPELEVSDSDGRVLSRSLMNSGPIILLSPVDVGQDYFVTVRRNASAVPSSNDFYVLTGQTVAFSQDETEASAGQNDGPSAAEPMPHTSASGVFQMHWASGGINETVDDADKDVDYRSFSAQGLEALEMFCFSRAAGSGVINARFAILDPEGQVLRESVETSDAPVIWGYHYDAIEPPLELSGPGTYYLRVTADDQLQDVASRLYWCLLYTWPG